MGEVINTTDVEKSSPGSELDDVEKGVMRKEAQLGDRSGCNGGNLERASSNPTVPTGDFAGRPDDSSSEDTEDDEPPRSGLGRIMSRVTSASSVDEGPPPDGGRLAWAQCISGHFVISNSWGWINSFGVWQDYLPTLLPDRSSFEISFIGSLTVFLLFFLGTFTGRLTDAGFFRPLFIAGSILQLTGIFMTSLCKTYWQFMLAQGLCIGVGNGFLFCPSLALISTYFLKNRALALGIAACGSVTGGLIFPVMARELLPRIGFPWTIRAIGLIQLASLGVSNCLSRPRIKPRKAGPLIELAAFKELEYTSYAMAAFCFFWGVYFPFYYLAAYSRDALANSPFSFTASLNLLLVINGVGAIGRIVPNFVADRIGAVNIFIPICGTTSLLVLCWMAVRDPPGLYTWTVFYGVFAAGIQSLFPAALSFLTTDLRKLGVRMGMVFTIVSFAVLTGPPIAGAIIDSEAGYQGAQTFGGVSLAVAFVLLIVSKVVRMRKTGMGWKGKV